MRAAPVFDISIGGVSDSRKRLISAHKRMGSWQELANEMKLNFRYVWDYAVNGRLPRNPAIRKKLLGKRSVDEHLAMDKIQEMPPPLLKWSVENRQEI